MRKQITIAITILLVTAAGTAEAGPLLEEQRPAGGRTGDWQAVLASPLQPLSFDPMASRPPVEAIKVGGRRWWASLLAQAAVAVRLADAGGKERVASAAQEMLEARDLAFHLGVVREPNVHLRLKVGEKRGIPRVALQLVW